MLLCASEKDVETDFPFIDLFIVVAAGQDHVVGVFNAHEKAAGQVDITAEAGLDQRIVAILRLYQGGAGQGFDLAGAEAEKR